MSATVSQSSLLHQYESFYTLPEKRLSNCLRVLSMKSRLAKCTAKCLADITEALIWLNSQARRGRARRGLPRRANTPLAHGEARAGGDNDRIHLERAAIRNGG